MFTLLVAFSHSMQQELVAFRFSTDLRSSCKLPLPEYWRCFCNQKAIRIMDGCISIVLLQMLNLDLETKDVYAKHSAL